MNFVARKGQESGPRLMKHGDLVIVYERHDTVAHFFLNYGSTLQNRFGLFYHADFMGKPFGSKIKSRTSNGWIYALEPSPELWSSAVNTRTQIVNTMDACIITLNLDVFPGCVVVESGTGSGCMTLSLARAVAPTGHVHTYEYNPNRAETARAEFSKLGVGHLVTVTCRDVCGKYADNEGGFPGVPDLGADAVFLDLPEPWLAIDHVLRVLKPGRTLCTYSPCIEQVMKTCNKLRDGGFHSIRMLEVRQRPHDGRRYMYDEVDLGLGMNDSAETVPISASASGSGSSSSAGSSSSSSSSTSCSSSSSSGSSGSCAAENEPNKRQKLSDGTAATATSVATTATSVEAGEAASTVESGEAAVAEHPINPYRITYIPPVLPPKEFSVVRAIPEMKGHTAFLTFAVRASLPNSAEGKKK